MPSSTRGSVTSAASGPAPAEAVPGRVAEGRSPRRPAGGSSTGRWYVDVWLQILRRKPLGTVGGLIVLAMLGAAVLAGVITPYGYSQTSLSERFQFMSGAHWLGTDQLGRDLLTRLV